jgi:hypothetical protein
VDQTALKNRSSGAGRRFYSRARDHLSRPRASKNAERVPGLCGEGRTRPSTLPGTALRCRLPACRATPLAAPPGDPLSHPLSVSNWVDCGLLDGRRGGQNRTSEAWGVLSGLRCRRLLIRRFWVRIPGGAPDLAARIERRVRVRGTPPAGTVPGTESAANSRRCVAPYGKLAHGLNIANARPRIALHNRRIWRIPRANGSAARLVNGPDTQQRSGGGRGRGRGATRRTRMAKPRIDNRASASVLSILVNYPLWKVRARP